MITLAQLHALIAAGESLSVEFKGEEHGALSDRDISEVVVCMANTDGGTLLIGVEDDRRITGARSRHGTSTDPTRLQAAIFNNTEPRINTRISVIPAPEGTVIAVEIDRYPEVCSTKAGVCVRRVMGAHGPECVPFYPHEHMLITNSGSLPDGITLQNILVHEPKPRDPRLYDAAKRIGLVEKTGRGVDKIFLDQLRYGRPAPNYERSDASGVRVVLRGGKANLAFTRFVYEQDKAGQPLTLDELLILNQLEVERRLNTTTVAATLCLNQDYLRHEKFYASWHIAYVP